MYYCGGNTENETGSSTHTRYIIFWELTRVNNIWRGVYFKLLHLPTIYIHHCPKHLLWPFRFNISRQTTANNFENGFPLPLCHDRVLWKLGVDISIHMNIFIMHNLKYPGLQCPRPAWPQPHSPASYLLELQTPAWNLLLSSNSFETKHNRLVTRIILYKKKSSFLS